MSARPLSPEILEAAAQLVASAGSDGLTMDELARATGLSRATLYRRTGGRRAVLDALAAEGTEVGDLSEARTRILTGARAVFGRSGFDGATIEEIAAEANVGTATVYRQFGDKEGLIAAFLDELSPRRAVRDAAARPSDDLRADLERVAQRMLAGAQKEAPVFRLMMLESLRGGPLMPRVRELSPTRTLPSIAKLLSWHMNAGRLPKADARQLAQAFSGMVLAFGVIGPLLGGLPPVDPAATARLIADLFLRGALAARRSHESPRRRRA